MLVVGGGAAGIFAAWRAATLGARVVILEKTVRIGTKIMVSGGGKCNVAHDGPLEDVLRAFRPKEARFLRPACYRLSNDQIIEFFTSAGLRVYTREDGRVFPVDQTAKDVVAILRSVLDDAGVEVRLQTPVTQLLIEDGAVAGVRCKHSTTVEPRAESGAGAYRAATAANLLRELPSVAVDANGGEFEIRCPRVIVSTGGSSYPTSGTTGDGYAWARAVGHRVERVHAALAPIYVHLDEAWTSLSGISLRDIVLKARQEKEIARWRGDLLFTHQGISGPCALGISRIVEEKRSQGPITLVLDLAPTQGAEELSEELRKFVAENARRQVSRYVEDRLPERLVPEFFRAAKVDSTVVNGRLDRKARNRILETMKAWPIGEVRHVPLEKGEVVAGGVSLEEVDPKTMASRRVPGLYLCGEVLDIAGPVGGYNLQAAFATGFVAGETAALSLMS